MTEVHTFIRLDDKPVDKAIQLIKEYIESVGGRVHGFVGCREPHRNETYQWKPDDDWEPKVREILLTTPDAKLFAVDSTRESFEEWIKSPPQEQMCDRFLATFSQWKGQYKKYEVQLAWEAWQAAIKTVNP